jgi:hypothetical protein
VDSGYFNTRWNDVVLEYQIGFGCAKIQRRCFGCDDVSKIVVSTYWARALKARVSLNVQGLRFFRREGLSIDGPQQRGRGSKFENIMEQNQNQPNLESVQCILVYSNYSF